MLVASAHANNDKHAAEQAYYDWQVGQCYNPSYVYVYDAHIGKKRRILIPCGKCYHCIETKINEWTTRMYAHAEDFKHIYFITLTYRSFTDGALPLNKLLMQNLSQAVWTRDNLNETRHLSYNPSLLCKDHYQRFFKRLRANTGIKDLTYVVSGEYGTKYGRPHYHCVIFTNSELTKADVCRAWSLAMFRTDSGEWQLRRNQKKNGTPFDFPIGRVDFHDLVSNGTFNTTAKIKIDGTYMNAANCFSYVCKYVVKREHANLCRVRRAYRLLYKKNDYYKIFRKEVAANVAKEYLSEFYSPEQLPNIINNLKRFKNEKIEYRDHVSVFRDKMSLSSSVLRFKCSIIEDYYPRYLSEFMYKFRPFVEFSRGTPIGSIYAKRNLPEFIQGVFTRPLLQESGYVVPTYFRRKADEYLYGLRLFHSTMSSDSFNFGCLPLLKRRLYNLYSHPNTAILSSRFVQDSKRIGENFKNSFALRDLSTGERICVKDFEMAHFKYDRHLRKYIHTRSVPVGEFIRYWCAQLDEEMKRYRIKRERCEQNMRLRERGLLMLTDLGCNTDALLSSFEERTRQFLEENNKLYDSIHMSAE